MTTDKWQFTVHVKHDNAELVCGVAMHNTLLGDGWMRICRIRSHNWILSWWPAVPR